MLFYIPAAILVYCCDQTTLITSFFYMLCDHEIKKTMYLGKKRLCSWRLHTGLLRYFSRERWLPLKFSIMSFSLSVVSLSNNLSHFLPWICTQNCVSHTYFYVSICRLVKKTMPLIISICLEKLIFKSLFEGWSISYYIKETFSASTLFWLFLWCYSKSQWKAPLSVLQLKQQSTAYVSSLAQL